MPEFSPGETKIAIVAMSNPTVKAFDYVAELYMGTDLVLMAREDFHLEAEESKDISLLVIMPSVAGTYPVYIGVFSDGQSIGLYKAIEDVVIRTPVPVVETLRPNAPGDETALSDSGDTPNWRCVDDVVPDEDETYVLNRVTTWRRDLYKLPLPVGSGAITSIKVYMRVTGKGYSGMRAKQSIKSNGIVTDAPQVTPPTAWQTFGRQWDNNPANGQPWTWADIATLQIGVSLLAGESRVRCTQVYVEVHYTTG